jgi:hypothetical protein
MARSTKASQQQRQHSTLIVAVTGHRWNRIPEPVQERVRANTGAALAHIDAAARRRGLQPALHTGLAEGADRFTAWSALALGWGLVAPLPKPVKQYETDFSDAASVAEFRALCALAEVRPPRGPVGEDAEPYVRLATKLLSAANVLLAIWDGGPPAGPGGTPAVIADAVGAGLPVAWVHAHGTEPTRIIGPRGPRVPAKGIGAEVLKRARWIVSPA